VHANRWRCSAAARCLLIVSLLECCEEPERGEGRGASAVQVAGRKRRRGEDKLLLLACGSGTHARLFASVQSSAVKCSQRGWAAAGERVGGGVLLVR